MFETQVSSELTLTRDFPYDDRNPPSLTASDLAAHVRGIKTPFLLALLGAGHYNGWAAHCQNQSIATMLANHWHVVGWNWSCHGEETNNEKNYRVFYMGIHLKRPALPKVLDHSAGSFGCSDKVYTAFGDALGNQANGFHMGPKNGLRLYCGLPLTLEQAKQLQAKDWHPIARTSLWFLGKLPEELPEAEWSKYVVQGERA